MTGCSNPFAVREFAPLCAGKQRIAFPQGNVGKLPPTLGQSERQIDPALRSHAFENQQLAAGPKQRTNMLQGDSDIDCRVEDIGGDDEIKSLAGQPLFSRRNSISRIRKITNGNAAKSSAALRRMSATNQ